MDAKKAIRSQYLAALAMLEQALVKCPEATWNAPEDKNKFWQVAYHALFFTHLYLQKTIEDFKPWAKHWEGAERPGAVTDKAGPVYTRDELRAYLKICQTIAIEQSAALDPEAPSGFHWLPFSKLELQFYNIRHLQQHVGELYERLGARADIELDWVTLSTD
jgi:hypothetical protein